MDKNVKMVPIENLRLPCLICKEWFKPTKESHVFVDTINPKLELPICPRCFKKIAKFGAEIGNPHWDKIAKL